jgi:hypothetical protein
MRTGRSRRLRTGAPPPHSCCRAYWAHLRRVVKGKGRARQGHHGSADEGGCIRHDGRAARPLVRADLRRTVATGLQRLGVRLELTEAVLNHISGSRGGIAGVYQRHDWAAEKRSALDVWAAHVLAIAVQRTPADNVVKLVRGR